jgi:hypothetical protein
MRFAAIALFCFLTWSAALAQADRMQALVQSVDVPAGERLVLRAEAAGYQIYRCTAHGGSAEWTFQAPEAKLMIAGAEIGVHRAGPSWVHQDGSVVFGEVLAKAPSPNPGSIPVLLLKAARTEGKGEFTSVNYIQRKDTSGGIAPTEGCDAGHIGAEARVPYTASYLFYRAAAE